MKNFETIIEDILLFYAEMSVWFNPLWEIYETKHCGLYNTKEEAVNTELEWLKQETVI